jgi:hypothetical protein
MLLYFDIAGTAIFIAKYSFFVAYLLLAYVCRVAIIALLALCGMT